jgi:hypothetical protein
MLIFAVVAVARLAVSGMVGGDFMNSVVDCRCVAHGARVTSEAPVSAVAFDLLTVENSVADSAGFAQVAHL